MAGEFDVYFAGECLEGFAPADVMAGIARTFKLSEEAAAKLMDGGQHRIKGGCDKATALRYREAMAAIGAQVSVKRSDAPPTEDIQTDAIAPAHQGSEAPHDHRDAKALVEGPADFSEGHSSVTHDAGTMAETSDSGIAWQEPEKPESPAEPELTIAPVGTILGNEEGTQPYALVNVPDYDVSAAGEVIPTLPDEREPVNPNTDHLRIDSD